VGECSTGLQILFLPLQVAAEKSECQFSVPHIFSVYLVSDTVEENLEVVVLSSLKETNSLVKSDS
jgi:hypothetical protein